MNKSKDVSILNITNDNDDHNISKFLSMYFWKMDEIALSNFWLMNKKQFDRVDDGAWERGQQAMILFVSVLDVVKKFVRLKSEAGVRIVNSRNIIYNGYRNGWS